MITDSFVCFNNRQIRFSQAMVNIKLVKPTEATGVRHPITGNTEIVIQQYEAPKFVSRVLQEIFEHLMDDDGKARFQRMKDCGALKLADTCENESNPADSLIVSIANYK